MSTPVKYTEKFEAIWISRGYGGNPQHEKYKYHYGQGYLLRNSLDGTEP